MLDRQVLFNQFLDYLQSPPPKPDYLGTAPETLKSFDPYQMVSEWIALRQEMKQQGKLLQAAQEQLQRELGASKAQNEDLQKRLETSQKQTSAQGTTEVAALEKRWEKEQESLLRSMLTVLDALDHACAHWQEQAEELPVRSPSSRKPKSFRARLAQALMNLSQKLSPSVNPQPSRISTSLAEMIASDRQGIELIRRNLIDVLKQQQILPIEAKGNSFDPQFMYAIARQAHSSPENTVIQEVVRGYLWRDRVLREAQVIVSAGQR